MDICTSVTNDISAVDKFYILFEYVCTQLFRDFLDIWNLYFRNKLHFAQKVACNNKRHNFINEIFHIHIIGIKHTRY